MGRYNYVVLFFALRQAQGERKGSKDLFEFGSEAALRDKGKFRKEGADYLVQDGDIVNIKFAV